MSLDGLVKKDCQHDRSQFSYLAHGQEHWTCLDCGEMVPPFYQDTQGG